MAVQGEIKSTTEISKFVGIGNFKPVKFNPTKEELEELLETDLDREPEYTGKKSSDDKPMSILSLWAKEEVTGKLFKFDFPLIDDEATSTDKSKKLYINQVGDNQYVDNEANLFDSFRNFTEIIDWKSPSGAISRKYSKGARPNEINVLGKKDFRVAKSGEKELYSFLKAWISEIDFTQPGASLFVDFDKLMEGDASELQSLVDGKFVTTVVADAIIRTDKEDPSKQYQKVSRKAFMPGKFFKYVKLGSFPGNLEKIWKEFQDGVNRETAEHSLDLIHKYDPEKDINTADKTKINSDDNSY